MAAIVDFFSRRVVLVDDEHRDDGPARSGDLATGKRDAASSFRSRQPILQ